MSLEIRALTKRFGGVTALAAVELAVADRQAFGLIGPNGAGKTTLINCVSGHLRADMGAIVLDGRDIAREPAHRLAALGVARTFQGVRLFKGLTAIENVEIGAHARTRSDVVRRLWPFARVDAEARDRALALLDRVGLRRRSSALAGELAYGDQRRLEIARALASRPRLLILDEPAAGMNQSESGGLRVLIRSLVDEGITIVLIEHDMRLVMGSCERVAVLSFGRKIAEGSPAEIQADPVVREAYLGSEDVA